MRADRTIAKRGRKKGVALVAATAEVQIAEQERQFRELLEYCPAALVVVDEDGHLLFHNARLRSARSRFLRGSAQQVPARQYPQLSVEREPAFWHRCFRWWLAWCHSHGGTRI